MTELASEKSLRAIPNNPDAETAVLSCLLQWPDECFEAVDSTPGSDELFYNPGNQLIWRAISDLSKNHQPIDLVTVTTKLGETGDLEKVGGPGAISELLTDIPTKALLASYLQFLSESLLRRRIIRAGSSLVSDAYDASTGLESAALGCLATINEFLEGGSGNSSEIRHIKQVALSTIEMIQERFENKGKLPGISTGFSDLDDATNGFIPGKVHVVAARPGMGKTAIGFQFVQNAAEDGVPCVVFSAEMFAEELVSRGISARSGIDGLNMARGEIERSQFPKVQNAAVKLSNLPIWINDKANMSIKDIISGTRRMVRESGARLVLIDYLQYIQEPEGSRNRVDAVTKLSNELTNLAKETGAAFIVLAQLNRSSESRADRKPISADLRDSGAIEQDAYGIILMHEQESEDKAALVDVDLIVSKWRGGRLGPIPVLFEKPISRFKTKYKP